MTIGGESSSYPNPYGRYMMMCPIKNSGKEQQKKSKENIKLFAKEKIQVRLNIYNTNVSCIHLIIKDVESFIICLVIYFDCRTKAFHYWRRRSILYSPQPKTIFYQDQPVRKKKQITDLIHQPFFEILEMWKILTYH